MRADGDTRTLGRVDGGIDCKVSRADDDFVAVVALDQRQEIVEEVTSLVGGFVHFPIGGDEFFSHDGPFSNTGVGSDSRDNFSAART